MVRVRSATRSARCPLSVAMEKSPMVAELRSPSVAG